MPFEEDDLEAILEKFIEYSDRRLSEQFSEIASVDALIELRADFEKRVRSYFKEVVRETNSAVSQLHCENLLQTLALARPLSSNIHVADVQDIESNLMQKVKD
jgi:hypothetical protein